MFGVSILWAGPILRVFYGAAYHTATSIFVLLLFGVSAASYAASHVWLLSTRGWGVRALAACNLGSLVIGVITTLTLSSSAGARAAAVGFLVGSVVSALSTTILVWVADRMPWSWLMVHVACGYAFLVGAVVLEPEPGPIPRVLTTLLFLATWVVISWRDLIVVVADPRVWTSRRRYRQA